MARRGKVAPQAAKGLEMGSFPDNPHGLIAEAAVKAERLGGPAVVHLPATDCSAPCTIWIHPEACRCGCLSP